MLEKPELADEIILECLDRDYAVLSPQLTFLPLGADANTAVYRASSQQGDYFVKLRGEIFSEHSATIPFVLKEYGVAQVIAPLPNHAGRLWTPLGTYNLVLSPFVEGKNGFEQPLSAQQWIELGTVLRQIHTAALPAAILNGIPHEQFSPFFRDKARAFQSLAQQHVFRDPVAAVFAAFMRDKQIELNALLDYADALAQVVKGKQLPLTLCHGDIHVGNVLLTPDGSLYIVDWDTLMLAPVERDLMFMGAGIGTNTLYSPDEQAAYFFQGYGQYPSDQAALAYYRCERIVQDVYAYCQQILMTAGDSADRLEGLHQFQAQFLPDGVVERALQLARRVTA